MLNKEKFNKKLSVVALKIPVKLCQQYIRAFKGYIIKKPKIKPIIDEHNENQQIFEEEKHVNIESKLLLLHETIPDFEALPEKLKKFANDHQAIPLQYSIYLTYENFSYEQILYQLLPSNIEVPVSYETIGHIAHFNLHDNQKPYQSIISQVLLDKVPAIKTVINKNSMIENVYRVCPFDLIGGKSQYVTFVREHGFTFHLDYSKCYWNSRLSSEHQRLVDLFQPQDIICDLCCGVGPFVIPSLAKNCTVIANDLNPDCIEYLSLNIQKNHLNQSHYILSNLDLQQCYQSLSIKPHHYIMNLPSNSFDYLGSYLITVISYYLAMFTSIPSNLTTYHPIIHCYYFENSNIDYTSLSKKIYNILKKDDIPLDIFEVRDVSPAKTMYCISIYL